MGFFDRFKKQNKNEERIEPKAQATQRTNENGIEYSCTDDGRLVVVLIEGHPEREQFYDTTKLVVDNRTVDLNGRNLQNCMISWYGQDDCIHLNSEGKDMGRRGQFKNVLADFNVDLMWTDENYCLAVMKMLLNQNRVEGYLNRGLQDSPSIPCGKYVGGIELRGDLYEKVFYRELGEASHYSPEMIDKRQRLQEAVRRSQEQAKADKRAQIAKLQQELDDMEK